MLAISYRNEIFCIFDHIHLDFINYGSKLSNFLNIENTFTEAPCYTFALRKIP